MQPKTLTSLQTPVPFIGLQKRSHTWSPNHFQNNYNTDMTSTTGVNNRNISQLYLSNISSVPSASSLVKFGLKSVPWRVTKKSLSSPAPQNNDSATESKIQQGKEFVKSSQKVYSPSSESSDKLSDKQQKIKKCSSPSSCRSQQKSINLTKVKCVNGKNPILSAEKDQNIADSSFKAVTRRCSPLQAKLRNNSRSCDLVKSDSSYKKLGNKIQSGQTCVVSESNQRISPAKKQKTKVKSDHIENKSIVSVKSECLSSPVDQSKYCSQKFQKPGKAILQNVELHSKSKNVVNNYIDTHRTSSNVELNSEILEPIKASCQIPCFPKPQFNTLDKTLSKPNNQDIRPLVVVDAANKQNHEVVAGILNVNGHSKNIIPELNIPKRNSAKVDTWFKESQRSQSVEREKPIWTREKVSPLHSRFQRTKSFYDELSNQHEDKKSLYHVQSGKKNTLVNKSETKNDIITNIETKNNIINIKTKNSIRNTDTKNSLRNTDIKNSLRNTETKSNIINTETKSIQLGKSEAKNVIRNSEAKNDNLRNTETKINKFKNTETKNDKLRNTETKNDKLRNTETKNDKLRNNETKNDKLRNTETKNVKFRNTETKNEIGVLKNIDIQNYKKRNIEIQNDVFNNVTKTIKISATADNSDCLTSENTANLKKKVCYQPEVRSTARSIHSNSNLPTVVAKNSKSVHNNKNSKIISLKPSLPDPVTPYTPALFPLSVTSITTNVTIVIHNSGNNCKSIVVKDSIVEPKDIYYNNDNIVNNDAGVQDTSSSDSCDSVHCGQSSSIRGGGVMEDRRIITPHQQSPLNLPSDRTQSLPGFYNRPKSPPHKFKEEFNSKKKFHPYLKTDSFADRPVSKYTADPKTKSKNTENSSRNSGLADDSKKSRRFLGGLFKRRKKGNNSCSSSSECDVGGMKQKTSKKSKKKGPPKPESHKNMVEVQQVNSIIPPDQEYKGNYVIQTVTGKVIKMSPTGSLDREFSSYPDTQPLGIPPLTMVSQNCLGRPGVSLSHDSLAPSAVSWNSESAYGSINSSMRSSRLGRSSSNDTINRKERREALKTRVEKLRDKVHNSSSDEDATSIISSQFGSESSLNRTDSMNSRSRGSRTERYIRRKSQELETLKVETEKDRRNREIVQARILEIQKSQRMKGAKSEQNFVNLQPQYHHRGVSNMRSLPSQANAQSSFSLSTEPSSIARNNFTNSYFSEAQRSVSYDNNIHQPNFSRNIKCLGPMYMNSVGAVPPIPPPRDKSRVVSPMDMHRPMSYSFESLSQDPNLSPYNCNGIPVPYRNSFHKGSSPSPFLHTTPSCSPLPPTNGSLPPVSPCRRSFSEKQLTVLDQTQPSRPVPPKVYMPSNIIVNPTDINRPVNKQFTSQAEKRYSKTIPITSMPPSPSSDYSSYVSDNSSRITSLPLEIETKQSSNHTLTFPSIPVSSISVLNEVISEKGVSDSSQESGEASNKMLNSINRDKSDSGERVTSPISRYVPKPPKRNSSSLSKTTGEYLRKHLEMLNTLEKSDGENPLELHKKVEEAFIKEKERLEKSKCANFEEALKELELIYQSLNLNSEDIIDGAQKRDSGDIIDPTLDGESLKKKVSPDKTADDFHLRKVQLSNRKKPNVKKMRENTGSYMLVSPIHVPPSNLDFDLPINDQRNGKKEPDVICDDVTYRNAQRANAIKVLNPQLPFGIPIGPVTQCSNSDYLHSSSTPELPPISKKEPNIVTDDLAFRNLRKDLKSASNKSLNTSELDEILSEATESPLMSRRMFRSTSVDRMSVSSAVPTRKFDLQTPRKVKQHQKAKRGGKFFNSYKEAFTDNEGGTTSPYHWKRTPSWIERANLGANKWETASTSTETLTDISSMKAQSQPDIRQAIINESRNADGGPEDPFAFLVDEADCLPKRQDSPPLLVKVQATTKSQIMPVKIEAKSYKQVDVVFNNKPKPFYLTNENKEHLPQPKNLVDIAKLDDLISSISGIEKQMEKTVFKTNKKETDIFNEGLEVAKINIEKAIRSSFSSSNSEGKAVPGSESIVDHSTSLVDPSSCQPLSNRKFNLPSTHDIKVKTEDHTSEYTNDTTTKRALFRTEEHSNSLNNVNSLLETFAYNTLTPDNIITNLSLPTTDTSNCRTNVLSSYSNTLISSSNDDSPSPPTSIQATIVKTCDPDHSNSDIGPSDYTKSDDSEPNRNCSSSAVLR